VVEGREGKVGRRTFSMAASLLVLSIQGIAFSSLVLNASTMSLMMVSACCFASSVNLRWTNSAERRWPRTEET
jgi:hypothetical protein